MMHRLDADERRGQRRVAVIGSGIAGLAAAYRLDASAWVTLYEAGDRHGGHSHTVDITLDGVRHPVDTGFLVFNERTYPQLIALFAELGVATAESDMSFSVQAPADGIEWSGSSLSTVFAQRRNLVRPAFWRMLADLARFNALATRLAGDAAGLAERGQQPIGEFLDQHRFGAAFRDWYFLPMIGCIWSCPTAQMLAFPVETLIRFCHNHGLLQVTRRPRWYTVRGGSRTYVDRLLAGISDARASTPVLGVRRLPGGGCSVQTALGQERYDDVVLACHSDQALALLGNGASADERAVLGAIRYQSNRAVLHTDASVLPRRRAAWAAWNHASSGAGSDRDGICLHYLINRLQPIATDTPVIVTLNPLRPPRADSVHGEYDYAHPVFDAAAIAAQQRLPSLQGVGGTWFCGAWTRYGFHEDGLMSALHVVDRLQRRWAQAPRAVHAKSTRRTVA